MSGPGPAQAAQRNYLQSLHAEMSDKGVYVGMLYIGAIIENSAFHAWTEEARAAGTGRDWGPSRACSRQCERAVLRGLFTPDRASAPRPEAWDKFANGRPRFEDVGVLFTGDVHDWELYKLRMLNATHSCMAYLMALQGVVYVDEAMAIPAVRRYLEQFLSAEAIPTLTQIPGHPAAAYGQTVLARYENAGVRDQIARLCIDGTAKFPKFLIPTIERQLERGGPVGCAALALAGWARYLATTSAAERAPDPRSDRSAPLAARSLEDPLAFLELDDVFTPPLRESAWFRDAFASAAGSLAEFGPLGAIERLGAA